MHAAGAAELCNVLDSKKIRRGLITRNMKSAVDLFHQRFGVSLTFLSYITYILTTYEARTLLGLACSGVG